MLKPIILEHVSFKSRLATPNHEREIAVSWEELAKQSTMEPYSPKLIFRTNIALIFIL